MQEDETQTSAVPVCYYLQTHSQPGQVDRSVEVIREGSPRGVVLISHDAAAPPLRIPAGGLPGVHIPTEPGRYGDFSDLDRYLSAADWLDEKENPSADS
ncbi:MAG: hypothetical protein JWR37_6050 [Mycobacterium sp.]|nr:hypothetical protein [Mycobacterium sp.]